MMIRCIIKSIVLFAIVSLCAPGVVLAKVSLEEAKALGTTLTLFGAEKAGNADGSIPPYTGGLQPLPEYDKETMQVYINPYKDEKPLYKITAQNMDQYEDILTEGTKGLFKTYPETYYMNVYPTHRSMRYLDWILENTVKNATTATTSEDYEAVMGGHETGYPYGGIPFPIPKNGYEVMWNHRCAFAPALQDKGQTAYLVDSKGGISDLPYPHNLQAKPWYDSSGYLREKFYNAYIGFNSTQLGPPRSAGIVFLGMFIPDGSVKFWFYTPGQRRCRLAPDFAYDLPISAYGGVLVWDETFIFLGRTDRYNLKLIGKKEMLIPYNSFRIVSDMEPQQFLDKNHINPEAVRWEKHRVWIVEMDRKDGARHIYKKRRFYIDEDTWMAVASESYDDSDTLWRTSFNNTYPAYDVGGMNSLTWTYYDMIKGNYMQLSVGSMLPGMWDRAYNDPDEIKKINIPSTPREVEARGIR
jgi:hypothetical protein